MRAAVGVEVSQTGPHRVREMAAARGKRAALDGRPSPGCGDMDTTAVSPQTHVQRAQQSLPPSTPLPAKFYKCTIATIMVTVEGVLQLYTAW